jgi:hypothetical protein
MAFLHPEFAIRKLLRDAAAVVAANNADNTVCSIDAVPRNVVMPFVTYQRIQATTNHHMGGVVSSNLMMGTTEVSAFAESYEAAMTLADAIRATLDGAEIVTVTVAGNSATFERLHLNREDVDITEPSDASDSRVVTVTQEYEWSARP